MLISDSFVDRDMFMRYLGGGIGHRGSNPNVHHDTEAVGNDAEEESTDDPRAFVGADVDEPAAEHPSAADIDRNAAAVESIADLFQDTAVLLRPTEYDEGEEDYGYESSLADSVEQDDDRDIDLVDEVMDSLGAEDGEDATGADEDLEALEGYAAF